MKQIELKFNTIVKYLKVLILPVLLITTILSLPTPALADANKDTNVDMIRFIENPNQYKIKYNCNGGGLFPDLSSCKMDPKKGHYLTITVTRTVGGNVSKNFEILPHNGERNEGWLCEEGGGGTNRGYAATFNEIRGGNTYHLEDVCTAVSQAGHDTTLGKLKISETGEGKIKLEFSNNGNTKWDHKNGHPDYYSYSIDFNA